MPAFNGEIKLIAGNSHRELAQAISGELGIGLADAHVSHFPDGECDIKVNEDLRGTDCFVIQSTAPPVNENWAELLLIMDTLRRSSAGRITAVMPYYGYARKDRKDEGRVPISAKVVANTLAGGGCDRVVTLDLHAAQIQGFFDIPVDHLYAKPALLGRLREICEPNPMIVSPDVGGIKMARGYAKALDNADLAIVDKRRISGSEIAVEHIIGDVSGRPVVIVDDMISTGGSISEAARICRENGASSVIIVVSHAVFCGPALERLEAAPVDKVLVSDTIPRTEKDLPAKIEVVSVAPLLAQAISNIHDAKSVSLLFEEEEPVTA
ncbi:MAG: ribose-phosphate pyrophosphokinase [Planctomycetes bacterium]|nr:ribose-phosphate pyrophosphokinase [Planctomycetota bacterium]